MPMMWQKFFRDVIPYTVLAVEYYWRETNMTLKMEKLV